MNQTYPPDFEHASIGFPTVFADGVANVAPSHEVVKFYLSRLEPSFFANNTYKNQPVVQVVMPVSGFVHTAVFFQAALELLKSSGAITQQQIDDAANLLKK